ncbi:hypothetical protein JQF37_01700 [Pseudomonas sp. MIL9]|uniref:hypothetical protein n=1 Tax=Pseudomonas sp. MIL9 TaxID=2807620 RepID=UPI00194F7D64|nr:hypothetical protein [Pseudomonas sp. MIL9]MBM6442342.1 hypothetical protein [Pseudomonas sp. MIL9]
MSDYSELKKQAEAARDNCPIWYAGDCFSLRHMDLGDISFVAEANPRLILELLADAARYQHLKATWDDGLLLERLDSNVLPQDWDAEIDRAMSKEG